MRRPTLIRHRATISLPTKAPHGRGGDGPEMGDVAEMNKPGYRLVGSQPAGEHDHGDHEQPGPSLRPVRSRRCSAENSPLHNRSDGGRFWIFLGSGCAPLVEFDRFDRCPKGGRRRTDECGSAARGGELVQTAACRCRRRLTVRGLVQGVGFRPFVYALARECGLSGEVGNTADGVLIEVEGPADAVAGFGARVISRAPPLARIDDLDTAEMACRGGTEFVIQTSRRNSGRTLVSPDVATCADCLAELADPANRRYRHPFISCVNCGPRFTIVVDLPYDRPSTTMAELPLCGDCAAEYADPDDRRFHAQTVACPQCGPTLTLRNPTELEREQVGGAAIAE
ncbi:MAG: hydrogenase maturation protein HypF, partial [Pseudonocardiales bacterium]|nr:hydrogenase maturation protein HypF [Pseudonocardiales bacterium]